MQDKLNEADDKIIAARMTATRPVLTDPGESSNISRAQRSASGVTDHQWFDPTRDLSTITRQTCHSLQLRMDGPDDPLRDPRVPDLTLPGMILQTRPVRPHDEDSHEEEDDSQYNVEN